MIDEIPLWNKIACPIDFSSVATDKTFAPFGAYPAHNREDQLRITAVSLPFGVVGTTQIVTIPDRSSAVFPPS